LAHAIGQQDLLAARTPRQVKAAKRKAEAVYSNRTYRNTVRRVDEMAGISSSSKKTGQISVTRAEASDYQRMTLSYDKYIQSYHEDYQNGLLEFPLPSANQVVSADEKGFSTVPAQLKIVAAGPTRAAQIQLLAHSPQLQSKESVSASTRSRRFRHQKPIGLTDGQSEQTVSLTAIIWADGEISNRFQLIRQYERSDSSSIPVSYAAGLPVGTLLSCTPTGLQDERSYEELLNLILSEVENRKQMGAFGQPPLADNARVYLHVDGHYSHFSPAALDLALTNGVKHHFLTSHNSTNQQVPDMGFHKRLQTNYDLEVVFIFCKFL
jgi:hypothetical protein